MRLTLEGIRDRAAWEGAGISLPLFDPGKIAENTRRSPGWLHFGAGNIFRAFPARIMQRLLNEGAADTGIVACETFEAGMIKQIYLDHDCLSILASLSADGKAEYGVIASVTEALRPDGGHPGERGRLLGYFESPSLRMVTFTITEKGYAVWNAQGEPLPWIASDIAGGPDRAASTLGIVCLGLYRRWLAGAGALTLVSMDNCSSNGDKLREGILCIADGWSRAGSVPEGFAVDVRDRGKVGFPLTMIDKITPRPDEAIGRVLEEKGVEDVAILKTDKNTFIAPFVNAESTEYLVIEDSFPSGRPPLEKAGVYMTDRETVNRVERMKVSTCLNPLHTALAVFGCLLGYRKISDEMRDGDLVRLVRRIAYDEGMPVVTDPGIISPKAFADEVLNKRFPNPFIPDTPQRIATDTSQKLAVRFGETIKAYMDSASLSPSSLRAIPLVLAGWLRYLGGVDDRLEPMPLSPDPRLDEMRAALGAQAGLAPILSREDIFGADLIKAGLAERVSAYHARMSGGAGEVRRLLHEVVTDKA